MAGYQDFWEFFEDFHGGGTIGTEAGLDPWVWTETSSAGTMTAARLDHGATAGAAGVFRGAFDSTTEAQNGCLSFGDKLCWALGDVQGFSFRLKQNQATIDSASSIAFGIAGDRNDAIDSVAQAVLFRLIGSNSVVLESDDGTTDKDDIASGQSLTNAYKLFKCDLSKKSDVKFYMGDGGGRLIRVGKGTTFDVSAYTGNVQPFFQLQKTSDNNTDGVDIDFIHVWGKRST